MTRATQRLADDVQFRLRVQETASENHAERALSEYRLTPDERASLVDLAAAEAAAPFHGEVP